MTNKYPNFLVSICCISYNHALYIEDAMNGFCIQQTTFPYVAIIVDDASNDGEPDVIRGYLNTHFNMIDAREWETDDAKYIYARHKENKNCYFAVILLKYNFYSIKKSKESLYAEFEETAKYISICEGDDYWIDEKKIQTQVDMMEDNPDYSMCWHDAYRMDAVLKEYRGDFQRYNKETICPIEDLILGGGDFCPTASFLYRKDIRSTAPKYLFEQYIGDYPLQLYMALTGKVAYINRKMSVYRINVAGSWNRSHNYRSLEKRKTLWSKEIKIYNDFDKFSEYKYSKYFKQREYIYMFYEMIRLGDLHSARKFWYKIDLNRRSWDWILIVNMHGRYAIKNFVNKWLKKN